MARRQGLWPMLWNRLRIARRIFQIHPVMPATAFWRIYEAELILDHLDGRGAGLDLGCGDGTFASVLFSRVPSIRWTGVEIDEYDAALARRRGIYEQVLCCSGEDLPSPDASYDTVFSNCVMEHIVELDAVLAQVGRVLKEGGRFIFTVPRETFHEELLIPRVLRALGLGGLATRYCRNFDERLEIANLLPLDEWNKRLRGAGMQIGRTAPYATRRTTGCWDLAAAMTGGLAYLLSRGRKSPRKIQQSSGFLEKDRAWLGTLFFVAFLPLIVFTAVQETREPCAGWYIEAIRLGEAR